MAEAGGAKAAPAIVEVQPLPLQTPATVSISSAPTARHTSNAMAIDLLMAPVLRLSAGGFCVCATLGCAAFFWSAPSGACSAAVDSACACAGAACWAMQFWAAVQLAASSKLWSLWVTALTKLLRLLPLLLLAMLLPLLVMLTAASTDAVVLMGLSCAAPPMSVPPLTPASQLLSGMKCCHGCSCKLRCADGQVAAMAEAAAGSKALGIMTNDSANAAVLQSAVRVTVPSSAGITSLKLLVE